MPTIANIKARDALGAELRKWVEDNNFDAASPTGQLMLRVVDELDRMRTGDMSPADGEDDHGGAVDFEKPPLAASAPSFAEQVQQELNAAREQWPPIQRHAEAYAIIAEELDEFWDQVRLRAERRDPARMLRELYQIAAMCQRTAEDLNIERDGRSGEFAGLALLRIPASRCESERFRTCHEVWAKLRWTLARYEFEVCGAKPACEPLMVCDALLEIAALCHLAAEDLNLIRRAAAKPPASPCKVMTVGQLAHELSELIACHEGARNWSLIVASSPKGDKFSVLDRENGSSFGSFNMIDDADRYRELQNGQALVLWPV